MKNKHVRLKPALNHKQRVRHSLAADGMRFDNRLNIKSQQKPELIRQIRALVPNKTKPERRCPKTGNLKPTRESRKDKEDRDRLILSIAANAMYGLFFSMPIHYSRQKDECNKKRNRLPKWLPCRGIGDEVDRWDDAGLLESTIGVRNSGACEESEFKGTGKLVQLLNDLGVTLNDTEEELEDRPQLKIQNKDNKGERIVIAFNPSDEPYASIIDWTNKYNDFLQCFEVSIERFGLSYTLRRTSVAPVYHDLALSLGGRMYGAFYQQIPSEVRGELLIDKRPTVERDFSACFGRLLYNHPGYEGKEYMDDPYAVDNALDFLGLRGITYDSSRIIIKLAFQCMLNNTSRHDAIRALNWNDDLNKKSTLGYHNCKKIVTMIEDHHPDIKKHFYKNEGMRLMNIEASIAKLIIDECMRKGICVLTIHDSFIVDDRYKEHIEQIMIQSYYDVIGYNPIIK